jgi:hypothetical protein
MVAPKNQKRSLRSGLNPLAYEGVEPSSPSNMSTDVRDPVSGTSRDYQGFEVGDEWINRTTLDVFKLVSKDGGVATWLKFIEADGDVKYLTDDANTVVNADATGGIKIEGSTLVHTLSGVNKLTINLDGAVSSSYLTDDANSAVPALNVLTSAGSTVTINGDNIITLGDLVDVTGADALTLTTGDITLTAGSINMPHTDATGVTGVITNNGNRFIHNKGVHNTFVGDESGNFTMDPILAQQNVGVGQRALFSLTTGKNNCAVGVATLDSCTTGENNSFVGPGIGGDITTGSNNCGIGFDNFSSLTTGSFNIGIGTNVGDAYTGAESDNILINNTGVVGESGTIRIGVTGAGEQTRCFIAAIRGTTTDVNDAIPVLIDSAGQLGTISSSIRFKENIEDMGIDSKKIYDLHPVTFNYKSDASKKKQYGLIAEEVAQTFPHLAVKDNEGNIETVKYHELNTLLLNELIKLHKRVEELEVKLSTKE